MCSDLSAVDTSIDYSASSFPGHSLSALSSRRSNLRLFHLRLVPPELLRQQQPLHCKEANLPIPSPFVTNDAPSLLYLIPPLLPPRISEESPRAAAGRRVIPGTYQLPSGLISLNRNDPRIGGPFKLFLRDTRSFPVSLRRNRHNLQSR